MLSILLKPFAGRHYKKFLEKARPIVLRINELDKSYAVSYTHLTLPTTPYV